jgi:hypothetical protein
MGDLPSVHDDIMMASAHLRQDVGRERGQEAIELRRALSNFA